MPVVDWNEIRTEYLSGAGSYRQLADRFGVSFGTLEKRARREGWAEQRRQVSDKVATDLPAHVADQLTKSLSDHLRDTLLVLDETMAIGAAQIRARTLEFRSLGEAIAAIARVAKVKVEVATTLQNNGTAGEAASSTVAYLPAKDPRWHELDND